MEFRICNESHPDRTDRKFPKVEKIEFPDGHLETSLKSKKDSLNFDRYPVFTRENTPESWTDKQQSKYTDICLEIAGKCR